MKYLIIILIACITNGCLGQYPKAAINKEGKVYNGNAQTKDTIPYFGDDKMPYGNGFIQLDTHQDDMPYNKEELIFYGIPTPFTQQLNVQWYNDTIPYVDSTKIYWSKQVYWEGKMNGELERLNKKGHAKDISKNLLRYQDSAIKYELLLYKIRK